MSTKRLAEMPQKVPKSLQEILCLQEDQAEGGWNFGIVAGRGQPAHILVDTEKHYIVGVLVGCQEISTRRVDGEVTRHLPLCRDVLHQRERFGARVDRKDGDAVVAAIRGVKQLAV